MVETTVGKQFAGQGREVQVRQERGTTYNDVTKGTKTNLPDPQPRVPFVENKTSGLSGSKFDVAFGFFSRLGVPEQVARSFAALAVTSEKELDINFHDLVYEGDEGLVLTNLGLTQVNIYRPITSQLGFKAESNTLTNSATRGYLG